MHGTSVPRPSQGAQPLVVLAAWLKNAYHRDDKVISFPANTSEAIVQARPSGTQYGMQEVQAIVLALECHDSIACERLDSLSLIILCSIFMYSQECLAQQRGLYLLARALHRNERDTAREVDQKRDKKTAIGQAALTPLIKGFLKTDASDKLRRWLGILALELLEDCPENVEKLRSSPPKERYWKYLSRVIERGSCQILKLLAGSMIRELLSFGLSLHEFWQSDTRSNLYSKFPKGQHHNSQWVTSFEEFVDDLVLEKILTQEVSSVMFAHAVYVGDRNWNLTEALDILVTLSEELNIIVPANKANPAFYIDVPLKYILEVSFDTNFVPDSQRHTYGLTMRLDAGAETNCTLNAAGCAEQDMAIIFSSEKDAKTLERLLTPRNLRMNGSRPHIRSGAIDASEQFLSDDELAAPGPEISDSQALMRTASLASAINPYRHIVSTIDPSRLERVPISQRASAEHQDGTSISILEHEQYPRNISHIVEMAAHGIDISRHVDLVEQAIEGIDISQIDGLSHEGNQDRDTQAYVPTKALSNTRIRYPQALSSGKQESVGLFNRTSGTGPSSSLHWHTDLNAIQNVPDFRTRPSQQAISPLEQVENNRSPESQDGEHDDLYYASPKVTKGQRASPTILARENTREELERPLQLTVQRASAKTGLPIKLSRQLRNADGMVESHIEQTADDNLIASMNNGTGDAKKSTNGKKIKAAAPAKTSNVMKRSTKIMKKTAQRKGKAMATEEPPDASFANYDLLLSPKRSESTIQISADNNVTSSRLKPTKAPPNNQKKAKLIPKKARSAASSKGSVPKARKEMKNKAKANWSVPDSIPKRLSGTEMNEDDDAIWDVIQAHGEEKPQTLRESRQLAKTAKKRDTGVPKTVKNKAETQLPSDKGNPNKPGKAQTQDPIARPAKVEPAPAALSQSRPRRIAAIKANKKIQDLEESDAIMDDEEIVLAITHGKGQAALVAAKTPITQEVKYGGDDQARISGKLPTAKVPMKDSFPESVSPDSSEEQRSNSVAYFNAGSSPDKISLVRDVPTEAVLDTFVDKRNSSQKEDPTSATEISMLSIHRGPDDGLDKADTKFVEIGGGLFETKVDMVPDSVPQMYETVTETDPALPRSPKNKDVKQRNHDLGTTKSTGSENQGQVERVMPRVDGVSLDFNTKPDRVDEGVLPPQAPTAPMTVQIRQRRTSPRLAEAARNTLPNTTFTRRDPFVAKLNASMPKLEKICAKVNSKEVLEDAKSENKEESTNKSAEVARSPAEPKARAYNNNQATPNEEANQVKSRRRHLYFAMQVEGDGEYSMSQVLKYSSESKSASRTEIKRKMEQSGGTSNKKVKMAPREPLEGVSANRKPAYEAEKTPPPVASNRPLMIEFSAIGPRNQGTISTKKPGSSKNLGTRAPDATELRKHEVSNGRTDQVEGGFASVHGALGISLNDVQNDSKNAGGVQKESRGPPPQEQVEHPKTVNTVVTQQANPHEHRSKKRTLAFYVNDHVPWEHDSLSKRQKRDLETPPTAQMHHPKMLPEISPAFNHDRSQRLSSQNTRVNENGSPMPFLITRNENTTADEQYSDEDDGKEALAKARLEEKFVLQDDDPIEPETFFPLPPHVSAISKSQPKTRAYQVLSNNSKQVPSSPHASSAFGAMPPHHLCHDGEILNAETKELIIPIKPQDPFLTATQNPENSFMEALRKSSELAAKRFLSGANDREESGGHVVCQSLDMGEDPDKTLVEPNLKKRRNWQVEVSESSSNSRSDSSTLASPPDESSGEESDAEAEAIWRKGLEPHQDNMLECLLTISHRLVRHLIDKETAIKDIVTDFANHGNSLVESYEKALQEHIDSHRSNDDHQYQNLVNMLKKAQADRAMTSKEVVKGHVRNMQAQWEMQQEALREKLAAALEACAD